MKRWKHTYAFMAGAATALVAAGHAWLVFLAGLAVGGLVVLTWRLAWRFVHRIDRALPDRGDRRKLTDVLHPLTEHDFEQLLYDNDYLDGAEQGVRSARRTMGRQDGRAQELNRLGWGSSQTEDIPF